MKTIQVPLKEKSYFVFVNGATPFQIPSSVRKILAAASRLVILTDSRLAGSHLKEVRAVLKKINPITDAIIIPSGEKEKNLKRVEQVYQRLLALKVDRSSVLLNLGGGVIGDLGGFVAATMLRGIRFVQIPTSLVGQVDAAIGGKTGVNHPMGKNLIGAFHQPLFVLNHIPFLKTLPERDFRAALAEVIKYGVIGDLFLFSFLEKNRKKVLSRDPATLSFLVEQSARAKAWVVGRDEKESGLRMTLNFGHTLGHAIEKQTGYGSWRHGEAVAQGMRLAARISLRQKQCFLPAVVRLETLLKDYGLLKKKVKTARGRLIQAVLLDKKGFKGKVRFVFMRGIGKVLVKAVPPRQLQWV